MRTKQEIKDEIKIIEDRLVRYSKSRRGIDKGPKGKFSIRLGQSLLHVLRNDVTESHIRNCFDFIETTPEDETIRNSMLLARRWMDGIHDYQPSWDWEMVVTGKFPFEGDPLDSHLPKKKPSVWYRLKKMYDCARVTNDPLSMVLLFGLSGVLSMQDITIFEWSWWLIMVPVVVIDARSYIRGLNYLSNRTKYDEKYKDETI